MTAKIFRRTVHDQVSSRLKGPLENRRRPPFLLLTIFLLGRAWYLELQATDHWKGIWAKRSRKILLASTAVSAVIWGLRFGGVLGGGLF